jgi:hypothetical protein
MASRRFREAVKERCAADVGFYVDSFVWTFDPRGEDRLMPWVSWPYQVRAMAKMVECIRIGADLVIEKSRDMGASWLSLLVMEWLWHFRRAMTFLMISRKEDLVDAPGVPDSLFWKLDFVHQHLPQWLRVDLERRRLHFGNLDNGSTIDGESTTAAAGVGGRRTAVFVDEFSRIEEGYQLLAGTADVTRCRIFNFTPFGIGNAAYELATRQDMAKLRLHWSEHPHKAAGLYRWEPEEQQPQLLDKEYPYTSWYPYVQDGRLRSPWYDGECKRRANDREVAEMIDIDYQGSEYQFFDARVIKELQQTTALPAVWEGDIEFEAETGRLLGLVPCKGGPLKLWCPRGTQGLPAPGRYGIGADIAAGTGATNSCISVVDGRTGERVGEYVTPYLRPEQLAGRAVAMCRLFGSEEGEGAAFAWEMQGPGVVFGKRVIELGYRNVYYRTNEHSLKKTVSDTPGWYPTPDNRRTVLEEYRAALASRAFVNRSTEALEECLRFVHRRTGVVEHAEQEGGRDPSGARANHGDRVIADALAWKMARGEGRVAKKEETPQETPGTLAWRRALHEQKRKAAGEW